MKPIKLLTLTSLNYLGIFLVLTLFFFGIFYFIIQKEVFKSTDEVLYNRKMHVLEQFSKNKGNISPEVFGYTDFVITPLSQERTGADVYSDTLIYETVDKEWDEFRKLASIVEVDGKHYRMEIAIPRLETHEIVESLIESLLVVFIVMVVSFYLSTRYLSKKLWKPFYDTLRLLNGFEVEQSNGLELTSSRIEEFVALNKSIQDLTGRTRRTFIDQKQFIENASHELQTPLAITQSKLELFIEDPHLTEHQSEIIQTLINSTQRLARLNKTLLLLSKIENQQFLEKEEVHLKPLLEEILSNFEEQLETLKINVKMDFAGDGTLHANKIVADLLLTNLIKNAFFHNAPNGSINIQVEARSFSISNTSANGAIPKEKLFQRFYKQSTAKDSWGLGLAMVKKICDINQWQLSYSYVESQHVFVVFF